MGKIDDLRIYSRALTADDIEGLRLDLRIKSTVAISGASTVPAGSISFNTVAGQSYALQWTTNLTVWTDSAKVARDGTPAFVPVLLNDPVQLFRVRRE